MANPFKLFFPRRMVGIDVGISSVKIVEISKWAGGKTLENYGELNSEYFYKDASLNSEKGSYLVSNDFASRAIRAVLDEARIKTRAAIFSLPDFSTFCTSFDIPYMTQKEIPDAIRFNASQYITLPVSEVTLDWHIIPNAPGNKNSSLKVFLVAVPNQVVQQYQAMARMAGLELYALEAEAFGVARALVKDNKKTICLVDIGVQSSTINIIDGGFLKRSYSFNFNSNQLVRAVSSALGIPMAEARDISVRDGLMSGRQDVLKTLYLLVDPLLIEIKSVCAEFLQSDQKEIGDIYVTGSIANLPGLKDYVAQSLKKPVSVPNCFSEFLYPPILEETLRQTGPGFCAAVGVAMGGLEA